MPGLLLKLARKLKANNSKHFIKNEPRSFLKLNILFCKLSIFINLPVKIAEQLDPIFGKIIMKKLD